MKEKKFKVILVFRFISSFKCQFLCWFKVYPHQVIYTKKTEYPKLLTESRAGDKSPPPWPQQLSIFLKSLSDFYLGKVAFFFLTTQKTTITKPVLALPPTHRAGVPQDWTLPLVTMLGNQRYDLSSMYTWWALAFPSLSPSPCLPPPKEGT